MTGFEWSDFLGFEKIIAPKVVKVVYWVGLVGIALLAGSSVLGGLGMMRYSFSIGLGTVIFGLIGAAVGGLLWRIFCEAYIVFFGIYDRLGEVRDAIEKREG